MLRSGLSLGRKPSTLKVLQQEQPSGADPFAGVAFRHPRVFVTVLSPLQVPVGFDLVRSAFAEGGEALVVQNGWDYSLENNLRNTAFFEGQAQEFTIASPECLNQGAALQSLGAGLFQDPGYPICISLYGHRHGVELLSDGADAARNLALFRGISPRMRLSLKACLILSLLGVLLSYSFDLECFLENGQACVQVCDQASEDVCSEPLLGSTPSAALVTRLFVLQPYVQGPAVLVAFLPQERVFSSFLTLLPVGLRAPPAAC